MRTVAATAATVLLMIAGTAAAAAAQGLQTGILQGTVRDAGGETLPGVTITVESPALQGSRETGSDANGVYILHGLPPGLYTVSFALTGFETVRLDTRVDLGRVTRLDTTLRIAGIVAQVAVTATIPSPLATATGGTNLTHDEFDRLPGTRTVSEIAELSPGVTGRRTTPDAGQLHISGAPAYDSVFLVDGVDVNDNLSGAPNALFTEDALDQVQILTDGISAEYGRFSGGVVNAVTRSGGNIFSGSLRLQFTDDRWTARTPFEVGEGLERPGNLNTVYEGTVGGPIVRDRLWFFAAGRAAEMTNPDPLPQTGVPFERVITNRRGEIKLTGTIARQHTVQGSVLTNPTEQRAPAFLFSIDPATAVDSRLPNTRVVASWRGIVANRAFATAQFSEKRFGFRDSGGRSTSIADSPFVTLTQDLAHYNAPYFDATDPEDRNNRQFTGSVSYVVTTARTGSHDLKGGVERYRSQLRGGNSQSATGYVFVADYVEDPSGRPALDAEGRLLPRFVAGETLLEQWIATRGARIDLRTTSLYAQDRWTAHRRWTVNAGLRYERVRGDTTGDLMVVDTDAWMPRLGTTFDATGDGRMVLQGTYGHYSGRYTEAQFGRNSPVGNPSLLLGVYTGPDGEGRTFAPGLYPGNYEIVFGDFPTANVIVEDGLSSPTTREWTAGSGWQYGRGFARATYVWRSMHAFVEDFITRETGVTTVSQGGITGEFQNILLRNTDEPERRYQGLVFQSRHTLSPAVSLSGHWTVQIRNHGNFEGEATSQPAISTPIGDYPEMRLPDRHYPVGRLSAFQRHKVRLWTTLSPDLGRLGQPAVSVMYRYDSGTTFSLTATGVPLTPQQDALLADYASLPLSQTLFFEGRGTGQFDDSHLVDLAASYQLPLWRTLGPWLRLELINVFNGQPLIRHNVTVRPDPASPLDTLGLPTGFVPDDRFGQGESTTHYPLPRTFRIGVGFRF